MTGRLPAWIAAALVAGAALGLGLNLAEQSGQVSRESVLAVATIGERVGKVFLALLSMVVVPLVFSSVVVAISSVSGTVSAAKLGARTVAWYLCTSALAIGTGLVLVNLFQPGAGLDYDALMAASASELETVGKTVAKVESRSAGELLWELVGRSVPPNVVEAASSNRQLLSLLVFAVLFGLFTARVGGEPAERIRGFFDAVQTVMLAMTEGILVLAPIGIFGYLFSVTAATGLALAGALAAYLLTVFAGLALHGLVVLPLLLYGLGGRSPLAYARACGRALMMAFSTASSSGTLPVTMECVEQAGVRREVSSFTLPLGATVNMDGTALYEVVAVLFIGQMLGDMPLASQVIVALTALLVSVGAAGIPHAGLVMMVVILEAVGLPTEATLVLLAVDRVADMARTTINVWSDAVGAAVVDKSLT